MIESIRAVQPFFVNNTTLYYKKILHGTPYVHFYSFTANTAETAFSAAVPDGCADILFEFYDGGAAGYLYGFVTEKNRLKLRHGADYFGVRFRPGFLPECLDVSLPEIVNTCIPLENLTGMGHLAEKMAAQPDFRTKMETVFNFIGERWRIHELLRQFVGVINESNGICRIDELEQKTLYSARYISKVFNENMGMPPKLFARHVRLQRLLTAMNSTNPPVFSNLAADFGYFDQAHLYKEFKQFTSVTPREYLDVISVKNYNKKLIYV